METKINCPNFLVIIPERSFESLVGVKMNLIIAEFYWGDETYNRFPENFIEKLWKTIRIKSIGQSG